VTAASQPRRRRRWIGLRGRSLRFQIVVVLLILLTVSFAIVALVTAIALRTFLIQRLDQQLTAAGTRFSVSLEHLDDHDADNTDQLSATQGQAAGTLGARVLNGEVTAIAVIAHDNDDQSPGARDRQVVASLRPDNNPRTIDFPNLGDYRVLVSAGDDGDVFVTGLPEHPVDETITHLLLIELAVFAAALLLTGVATSLSVRWSLRPLHRVASTALEVSNLPLSTGTVTLRHRKPKRARSPTRSITCSNTSNRHYTTAMPARTICVTSSPTRVTNFGLQSPSSAAKPNTPSESAASYPSLSSKHSRESAVKQSAWGTSSTTFSCSPVSTPAGHLNTAMST
jgi:hypothetical protein